MQLFLLRDIIFIVACATIFDWRENMEPLMKYINRIHRCAGQYRNVRLPKTELKSHQHVYILHVCRNPGISQEQLAKRICVNKSSVTRQLCILEKNGYIMRRPDSEDRRLLRVYPTSEAEGIYPEVVRIMKEWNDLLFTELNEKEREQFKEMLKRVTDRAIKAVEDENGIIPDTDDIQLSDNIYDKEA